ncbi:hypothetical protein [Nostoc sp.]
MELAVGKNRDTATVEIVDRNTILLQRGFCTRGFANANTNDIAD